MDKPKEWPPCQKCDSGSLLPLSDYGRDGAPITYKAWACSNPACGFNMFHRGAAKGSGTPVPFFGKGSFRK